MCQEFQFSQKREDSDGQAHLVGARDLVRQKHHDEVGEHFPQTSNAVRPPIAEWLALMLANREVDLALLVDNGHRLQGAVGMQLQAKIDGSGSLGRSGLKCLEVLCISQRVKTGIPQTGALIGHTPSTIITSRQSIYRTTMLKPCTTTPN